MAYEYAIYEKKGHVATITMNRPEVMNAIHPPATAELSAIWDDATADDNVWVIILTGSGEKAFSAGNDLKYTAAQGMPSGPRPKGGFGGLTDRIDIWKPMIAAVNGFALGGGFEMALACDIIIAADHARLGLPEPRVGLAAMAGGVHRLPRQIPLKIAMGYMLTGRHMTAQEALHLGIVNEVVPLKDLMSTVERWTNEILECAPLSVRATKQAAMMGLGIPLAQALSGSYPAISQMMHSEDVKEGPKAFAEKRKPNWKGK
ncbi:MAG: enoyl-CoA hydratase-related protein [Candidatus Binatia bacterium]